MIIYQSTKQTFLQQALLDDIETIVERHYRSATGSSVGAPEMRAWKHSLLEMAKVLQDEEIPDDAGVAIEYQLPQSSKRIDFIITGEDAKARSTIVIVELKQWSSSRRSDKDGIVWARRGGLAGETEGPHPSYQAWTYAAYLEDFNEAVIDRSVTLQPCAYLHNHPRDGEIDHQWYQPYIERAPLFLERERAKLQAFIRSHVHHGDKRQTLYAIEQGRIKPSKRLADSVVGMIQGRTEFLMIDDQKLVYETVLKASQKADTRKQVLIIEGGPGTGKSVVAINLLAALIGRRRNARYVSKNAAPRAVYEAKLTGTLSATRFRNLFSGSGAFVETPPDTFDALIVDEAHRLNEKSGLYRNLGDHQVRELIRASRCAAFFVDNDQRVTLHDVGHSSEIEAIAKEFDAQITHLNLTSQFRCNGSNGYLAWLDNVLEIRETANPTLDTRDFDFRVVDSPTELHELILRKNGKTNRARMVAGYCWPWPSKKDPKAWDIELPDYGYRRQWNLNQDSSLWIVKPGSEQQVGCIHTCQGLEVDYIGVIIGPDMVHRQGGIVTDSSKRARSDQSVKGIKKLAKGDPARARALGDLIVKNTYRTLMTRGMKGCYVYCTDPELAAYLKSKIIASPQDTVAAPSDPVDMVPSESISRSPLRLVSARERAEGVKAAPMIDLRIAAGAFSDAQSIDSHATDWVALPSWIAPGPDIFVAQVVGESMNQRIPNGSWCVFRAFPQGTRNGKVVVVQHRSIADPDTGGRYTIKVYSSEKVEDGEVGWRHRRITLRPDSDCAEYQPIVIDVGDEDEFKVLAEYLTTIE